MSNTAKETIEPTETSAWDTISWAEVERRVLRYQTIIYKATKKTKEKKLDIQKRLLVIPDSAAIQGLKSIPKISKRITESSLKELE